MISLCHSRLPSGISIPLQRRWTIVFCDYTDNMSSARIFKPAFESRMPRIDRRLVATACAWLERIDPGAHRRVKGLRLVTAYALAAMTATMADITRGATDRATLPALAGGFALWASVSEGRATRLEFI